MSSKQEYGDYQTPAYFAEKVCLYLKECRRINPSAVLEPTCGVGAFLKSSLLFDAKEYYGIEINPEYCSVCRTTVSSDKVQIVNADFFAFPSKSLIRDRRQILVIGNPPWATSSMLSALGSGNLPQKSNFKGMKGIDAITGEGNFDICEYMILQLVHEYRDSDTVIAMLCKTSVARNVFKELKRNCINFSSCDMLEFDAAKVFRISASACVLVIQLSEKAVSSDVCNVYDFESALESTVGPASVKSQFGYDNGQLYSRPGCHGMDCNAENFDGRCCFEWRQGVKHDCSKVMELTLKDEVLQNGLKETVCIEDDIVFPLVKSSMFKTPVIRSFSKYVIVTQKKAREDTAFLEHRLPKTWAYLSRNTGLFESRKSSIYRGAPPFSMFGVGSYSYSRYKVGVSGFYKHPLFSVLYSEDEKPVMTDDTSYFICFDKYDYAYIAMLLLNSEKVRDFLESIAFLDAKRPYTKKVLERIDFDKITSSVTYGELAVTEKKLHLECYADIPMYNAFKSLVHRINGKQ